MEETQQTTRLLGEDDERWMWQALRSHRLETSEQERLDILYHRLLFPQHSLSQESPPVFRSVHGQPCKAVYCTDIRRVAQRLPRDRERRHHWLVETVEDGFLAWTRHWSKELGHHVQGVFRSPSFERALMGAAAMCLLKPRTWVEPVED